MEQKTSTHAVITSKKGAGYLISILPPEILQRLKIVEVRPKDAILVTEKELTRL